MLTRKKQFESVRSRRTFIDLRTLICQMQSLNVYVRFHSRTCLDFSFYGREGQFDYKVLCDRRSAEITVFIDMVKQSMSRRDTLAFLRQIRRDMTFDEEIFLGTDYGLPGPSEMAFDK